MRTQTRGFNFCETIRSELLGSKRNFIQSQSDPCVFYKKGTTVICYVDDFLMLAQDEKLLENLISSLKEYFLCTDEGPEDGFLGVSFKSTDGQPALNQLQLIKQNRAIKSAMFKS